MAIFRVFAIAVLFLAGTHNPAMALDVTLTSRDGKVELTGTLLNFDGEFYRVDTKYGELTVDGVGVVCSGQGCPDPEDYVTRIRLSGAPAFGEVLLPALLEGFARHKGFVLHRDAQSPDSFSYVLADRATDQIVGEFRIDLANSDGSFAALIAGQADVAMTLRQVSPDEAIAARAAGLGDVRGPAQSHLVAFDGLVPVVAQGNPITAITSQQLSAVLAGKVTHWSELGGPNQPIALHVWANDTAPGQSMQSKLLDPERLTLSETAQSHATGASLLQAVEFDPMALGLTLQSARHSVWQLALTGTCGFSPDATRQNLKTQDYPLVQPLYLYVASHFPPRLLRDFLAYLTDPAAQLVIRRAGFADRMTEEVAIDVQGARLANAIGRVGEPGDLAELQRLTQTLGSFSRLSTTFRFRGGVTSLDAQSQANVRHLARQLEQGQYNERRLVFVGFSDGNGTAAVNHRIALRRAEAVRQAVTEMARTADLSRVDMGVDAFGHVLPTTCDGTILEHRINRRVEVWVQ